MQRTYRCGISHIYVKWVLILLVLTNWSIAISATASFVIPVKANGEWILPLNNTELASPYGRIIRTTVGQDTWADLNQDGEVDLRIISNSRIRATLSVPKQGQFQHLELELIEPSSVLRAKFSLSSDGREFQLFELAREVKAISYSTGLSEAADQRLCEFKESPRSSKWRLFAELTQSMSVDALGKIEWFNELIDPSCNSHRNLVAQAFAQLAVSSSRRDQKLFACAFSDGTRSRDVVNAQDRIIGLMGQNAKRSFIKCSASVGTNKLAKISNDTIELSEELLKSNSTTKITNTLFHESLHFGGNSDEKSVEKYERCCALTSGTGATCGVFDVVDLSQMEKFGLMTLFASMQKPTVDDINGLKKQIEERIRDDQANLTCMKKLPLESECRKKMQDAFSGFYKFLVEEKCQKLESLIASCDSVKVDLERALKVEAAKCERPTRGNDQSCIYVPHRELGAADTNQLNSTNARTRANAASRPPRFIATNDRNANANNLGGAAPAAQGANSANRGNRSPQAGAPPALTVPSLNNRELGNRQEIERAIGASRSVIGAVARTAEDELGQLASAVSPISRAYASTSRDSGSYESRPTRVRRGSADNRRDKSVKSPVTGAFEQLVGGAPSLELGNGQRLSYSFPAAQLGLDRTAGRTGETHRVADSSFEEGSSGASLSSRGDSNAHLAFRSSNAEAGASRVASNSGARPGGSGGGRGGPGLSASGGGSGGGAAAPAAAAPSAATQSPSALMNRMRLAKTREAVNKLIREPEFRMNLWFNRVEVRDGTQSVGYIESDTPPGMEWPGTAPREVWVLDDLMPNKRAGSR